MTAAEQRASFAEWYDTLDTVYRALPAEPDAPCPNCGAQALRLVFVGNPDTRVGYCSFWCDSCRFGIRPSRIEIPGGVAMFGFDSPSAEILAAVSEFQEVSPDIGSEDFEDDGDFEDLDDLDDDEDFGDDGNPPATLR